MPRASTNRTQPAIPPQVGVQPPPHPANIDALGIYRLPGHIFAAHLPTVHERKVSLIHSACQEVEQWRGRGLGVTESCRVVASRYGGVHVAADRRLKLGVWALVRRYYRWVKGGRAVTAFPYRYGWDKGLPKPRKNRGRRKKSSRSR